MNEFIYLNNLGSRLISIQIIQSFSILILNISNPMTQYFIFSNNFINHIIAQDCSKLDDEFIAYYINFIKSLSLKINKNTIQFFFHEQHNSFLLSESSMKFYNHPDSMIKTTVRNIFLTFLKLNFDPIYDYFMKLPGISYFPFLVLNLRDLIIKLNYESLSDTYTNINDINDDIVDIIMYFQDIFSIKLVKINNVLINCIFYYIIFPLIISAFTTLKKSRISITTSIYILTMFFKYIKEESFLNMLFSYIFFKKIDPIIIYYINNYPQSPKNFQEWNINKVENQIYSNYISFNFSENFIKSLVFQTNSNYPEIIAIFKKYEKTSDDYTDESFLRSIMEDVLSKFEPSEFNSMQAFHHSISLATGENVGLKTFNFKQRSIIKLSEYIYLKIKEKHDHNFIINECRENLMSYFKSKDDSLILLLSLLINTVHKSNISKDVLSWGQLLKASEFLSSESSTNNILKDIFSTINLSEMKKDNNTTDFTNIGSSLNFDLVDISKPFSIYENIFLEDEEENEISYHKDDDNSINPFSLKKSIEFHEDHEVNSLLDLDFLKIRTDKIMEKTQKHSITKKNLDKIIKLNIDNKINYDQSNIENEVEFDKKFFEFHFNKLKFQFEYDKNLVENLLILLTIEPSLRSVTLRLILENIENLILQGSIDRNHLDIFNKIYYSYISVIKLNIMTNKQIKENGCEFFESEWLNYKKDFNLTINSLISQPFLLVPFNLEDTISEYPKILNLQKTGLDFFKNSLTIFMNLFDLRSKIYLLFENLKEFFPLNLSSTNLEIDKPFSIANNSNIYQCKVKFGENKNLISTFMCIETNYLVFCAPDTLKTEFAIVNHRYPLRQLLVQIDKNDSKVLNIIAKEKQYLNELVIYFDDSNRTTIIKKQLEEFQKNSVSNQFILLVSYFDELLNKFNLDHNI